MNISIVERKTDPGVMQTLEEVMARVRAGETTGIALLEVSPTEVTCSIQGIDDRWRVLGILTHLLHKLAL